MVREANPNLIVTLYNGSSLSIPWLKENAKAILECWYPGEQGGRAIARILAGRANPGGRLPLTFYRDAADLPSFQCYDISEGFTYRYAEEVLYPFGYGLSYTEFACTDFGMNPAKQGIEGRMTIRNQGKMAGYETIQIYGEYAEKEEPRELIHVDKIWLEPGEERSISFCIPDSRLEKYDIMSGKSRIRKGRYRFFEAENARKMLLSCGLTRGEGQWNR